MYVVVRWLHRRARANIDDEIGFGRVTDNIVARNYFHGFSRVSTFTRAAVESVSPIAATSPPYSFRRGLTNVEFVVGRWIYYARANDGRRTISAFV